MGHYLESYYDPGCLFTAGEDIIKLVEIISSLSSESEEFVNYKQVIHLAPEETDENVIIGKNRIPCHI